MMIMGLRPPLFMHFSVPNLHVQCRQMTDCYLFREELLHLASSLINTFQVDLYQQQQVKSAAALTKKNSSFLHWLSVYLACYTYIIVQWLKNALIKI